MKTKLLSQKKIALLAKKWRKDNKKIVFTNGCFDLIHPGHIKILKKAREKGDIVILGLNSDSSIKKIKGKSRPILSQKARVEILSSIEYIDAIVLFKTTTPENLIKKIHPDILIKGSDWKNKKIVGKDFLDTYGGRVITVTLKEGFSTTAIIKKIKKTR